MHLLHYPVATKRPGRLELLTFAGYAPVNYGDPSGLSQQGHPLNGNTLNSARHPAK